jgi:hypothetical protein
LVWQKPAAIARIAQKSYFRSKKELLYRRSLAVHQEPDLWYTSVHIGSKGRKIRRGSTATRFGKRTCHVKIDFGEDF